MDATIIDYRPLSVPLRIVVEGVKRFVGRRLGRNEGVEGNLVPCLCSASQMAKTCNTTPGWPLRYRLLIEFTIPDLRAC
jgi:hypothetical protein